jgi:hypothetical protein
MLTHLTASVRRWTNPLILRGSDAAPLVRLADGSEDPATHVAQTDIGMLRGVTSSAADVSECTCPEPCERDHANE